MTDKVRMQHNDITKKSCPPKQPGFWSRLGVAIGTALGAAFVNR